MNIDDKNIKFTFYFDNNKYVVYSFKEEPEIGDTLFFAKQIKNQDIYENVPENEYEKVLSEYMDYLNSVGEAD